MALFNKNKVSISKNLKNNNKELSTEELSELLARKSKKLDYLAKLMKVKSCTAIIIIISAYIAVRQGLIGRFTLDSMFSITYFLLIETVILIFVFREKLFSLKDLYDSDERYHKILREIDERHKNEVSKYLDYID